MGEIGLNEWKKQSEWGIHGKSVEKVTEKMTKNKTDKGEKLWKEKEKFKLKKEVGEKENRKGRKKNKNKRKERQKKSRCKGKETKKLEKIKKIGLKKERSKTNKAR